MSIDRRGPAAHPVPGEMWRPHGGVRGADLPRGSVLFAGRFGRIFRALPAADFSDDDLKRLAVRMIAPEEEAPTTEDRDDDEESPDIDAGYTYLGQFIDHDLTFDPMSSLQKQNDPDALTNFRTPRFDLDCVYGRGPEDQPYLYEDDGLHMKLGRRLTGSESDAGARDLPRHRSEQGGRARALIGDPRNDENVIVAQLHAIILRFHNRVVDRLSRDGRTPSFGEVQRLVRWHYQWVVLHDFLPTIVGTPMLHRVLPHLAAAAAPDATRGEKPRQDGGGGRQGSGRYERKPDLRFVHWRDQPFIPIEFSAAAYRFGHSMVRPLYRVSTTVVGNGPPTDPVNGRLAIFTPDDGRLGLNGFREFPGEWAIDWSLFFTMTENAPRTGIRRVQKSYRIDTSLVNPLGTLPLSVAKEVRSLAERNLMRGRAMGLPSGQDVARAMDVEPIPDGELRVGKATEEAAGTNPLLTEISPAFAGRAPLWYYVLAEAQQQFERNETPIRLGEVGGRIVTEVFVGLLLGDSHSFLSQAPGWTPDASFMRDGRFGIAELIAQAMRARA
jgi:hypothetical protein